MVHTNVAAEGSPQDPKSINKYEVQPDEDAGGDHSKPAPFPKDKTEAVDQLQGKLGGYGRYQIIIYCLLGIVYMRGCWHALIPIYQGLDPGYHCRPAPGQSLNESVPGHTADGVWVYDSCKQYVNFSKGNQTEDCKRGWDYDFDDDQTSIVSEFSLTCERNYLIELSTTIYMVGTTCGVIFLAPVSERMGAKTVMLACLWVQAVVGTIMPWASSIGVFLMLKFFIGVCNMTIALCVAVMMPEAFDAAHREIPAIGIQFFWASGIMTLSLFAYLLPDWKHLQLLITLPINIFSITYIWLIPQSLPWLISKGKLKKARRVIQRFTAINKLPTIPNLDLLLMSFGEGKKTPKLVSESPTMPNAQSNSRLSERVSSEGSENDDKSLTSGPTYNVLHLFKYPRLRLYTIILCYLFLINALAYFGIMYSTPLLDGNQFLNLFYSGLVEIPAYILCIVTHKCIGRRRSISMFLLICGATNIAIPFIPDHSASGTDLTDLKLALTMIGKFGITGSYSAIYLYASEIFPTVIRNQGVGFCSFFENIGSIAAPNMVYINDEKANLPLTIFGAMTIVGSFVVLFLPETHHKPLPHSIEDVEGRKKSGDK